MLECPRVSYSPILQPGVVPDGRQHCVSFAHAHLNASASRVYASVPWPCALSRATCNARVLALPSGNIGLSRTTRL